MAKRYWLLKSEPGDYSIDDLERDGRIRWTGVRNYQARNLMRDEMSVGDGVLFYHSSAKPPAVVGIARVSAEAAPDKTASDPKSHYYDDKHTAKEPRWYAVEVEFVEKLPRAVPLDEIKESSELSDMVLVKRSRLSVQPVTKGEFDRVWKMGKG